MLSRGSDRLYALRVNDPYAVDAAFYDMVNRFDGEDSGLWLVYAGQTERPVLEVGTGTGRIAIELALHGHEVTGIDPSETMLAIARAKAEEEGVTATFVPGRLSDLSLEEGHYGFAIVPADVFLYCEDAIEQIEMLEALERCLHFDGLLAIDLPGPAAWLDPSLNGQPLLAFAGETESGEPLDAWHVREDDMGQQTRALRITYERTGADGLVRRSQSNHLLRYVYRYEMERLLEIAGFAVLDVYGDYELGPLTSESERMIFTARSRRG